MKLGLVFGATSVLLSLGSGTAMAADPGISDLPKSLADPVEESFIEVGPGTNGTLEGYFDAQMFADNTGVDASMRNGIAEQLRSAGFVTGYGREFYIPAHSDWLYEVAMVFGNASGARSVLSSNKVDYAREPGFGAFVDVQMNAGAFAVQYTTSDFHWTVIQFVKSNDLFAIARGSQNDFTTDLALAQGRKAFEVAPSGTAVLAPAPVPSALTRYLRPLEMAAFVAALVIGAALMAVVFLLFRPRPRRAPQPVSVDPKT